MRLYIRLITASMRARLQYKADFVITTIMYGVVILVDFLTIAVVAYRYNGVAGWSLAEIALLAGVVSASTGIYRTFAAEVNGFERYLVHGDFDGLLVRPWPTLASLAARNFDLGRLGAAVQGYLLMSFGLRAATAGQGPAWLTLYLLFLPVAGACIILAVAILTATAGFWLTRIDELQTFLLNAPSTAASYPLDIYPSWLRWTLTVVIPMGAIAFIPLNYGLGKGGTLLSLAVPYLTALLALLLALRIWRWGERHYQSTGN